MNCVRTLDLMVEALEGDLDSGLRAEFDEHLRDCDKCRHYVEQVQVSIETLKRSPRPGSHHPRYDALIEEYRKKFR